MTVNLSKLLNLGEPDTIIYLKVRDKIICHCLAQVPNIEFDQYYHFIAFDTYMSSKRERKLSSHWSVMQPLDKNALKAKSEAGEGNRYYNKDIIEGVSSVSPVSVSVTPRLFQTFERTCLNYKPIINKY